MFFRLITTTLLIASNLQKRSNFLNINLNIIFEKSLINELTPPANKAFVKDMSLSTIAWLFVVPLVYLRTTLVRPFYRPLGPYQ